MKVNSECSAEGKYPGAMSRWDNVSEICSMCGSAEAMSPLLNHDARMLMQASREFDDFELWREGVLLGRPAVVEMQQASMEGRQETKRNGGLNMGRYLNYLSNGKTERHFYKYVFGEQGSEIDLIQRIARNE